MGNKCSKPATDDADGEKDANPNIRRHVSKLHKKPSQQNTRIHTPLHEVHGRLQRDMEHAEKVIEAQDAIVLENGKQRRLQTVLDSRLSSESKRTPRSRSVAAATASIQDANDYFGQREEIMRRENTLSFSFSRQVKASDLERQANEILQVLRHNDKIRVFDAAPPKVGHGGQLHPRFPGDHFLTNLDLIERTDLFVVAKRMPKGAHLHIHFNACLLPHVLLDIAKTMKRMFITSDLPLTEPRNFERCEIQFSILPPAKEKPGDVFSVSYEPRQTMKFSDFRRRFSANFRNSDIPVDKWLEDKLVFGESATHNELQTSVGAWELFNGRTRMMKGLFNYETAYRRYTRLILEDFVNDNIQYAEIRPNFMKTNQLWTDDGTQQIDNEGIMRIIMEEYEAFQKESRGYFAGMKIIYCTPRSFSNELVAHALNECIEFKRRWPAWIAGFDLVGEEGKGRPIREFVFEFLAFRKRCEEEKLDIPFLFHCGETLEMGEDTDGNLFDALLLNSKRIGHGFALARHPYVMEHVKKRGICLELCPISNEILGLTPRVGGHSMYNLLANNVHCTVSSDNGTLFRYASFPSAVPFPSPFSLLSKNLC
jgi:adenosine deaminase CECR1